jgi:hypothetical protein
MFLEVQAHYRREFENPMLDVTSVAPSSAVRKIEQAGLDSKASNILGKVIGSNLLRNIDYRDIFVVFLILSRRMPGKQL